MSLVRLLLCAALTGVACQSASGKANGNYTDNANTDNMGRFGETTEDDTGTGRYRCGLRSSMIIFGHADIVKNGIMKLNSGFVGINISTAAFDTLTVTHTGDINVFLASGSRPVGRISEDTNVVQYVSGALDDLPAGRLFVNQVTVTQTEESTPTNNRPVDDNFVAAVTNGYLSVHTQVTIDDGTVKGYLFEDETEVDVEFLVVFVMLPLDNDETQISITCK